jgi:hypothetical protein
LAERFHDMAVVMRVDADVRLQTNCRCASATERGATRKEL